ncbi:MAG: restriction endonuclease subunit S [Chloroflexi bacterium]|nr:restriction endonuclease subunit S [Chloroflexota bacterium]
MSEMPDGWSRANLTSLLGHDGLFSDGDWVESKDQDPSGSIRLLQLADIGDGRFLDRSCRFVNEAKFKELRCTELRERDILVARMPDPLGRACLMPRLPQRCITVVDVAVIRPGPNAVTPEWLRHFLNSPEIRQTIELLSSGTTRKRISRNNLGQIELPVSPLNEQKRIADKLDALLARVDACRARLDRMPLILKRFRQAVLAAATSGRLTEEWRKERDIDNWIDVIFRDLLAKEEGAIRRGPFGSSIKKSFFVPTGYKVYEQKNAIQDDPELGEYYISEEKYHELESFAVRPGDFIASCAGTIGRISQLPVTAQAGVINQALMRLRVDRSVITDDYFLLLFRSPSFQTQILEGTQGSAMQNMASIQTIKTLQVEIPKLPEQHEIARRAEIIFTHADRLETRYRAARAQVERLTPSLLAKAFRGELVPQDPDDEPAAVLLERIRAARAKLGR